MAQKRYKQGPWPPTVDDQPVGFFQTADCVLRSDRSLAGPLRTATEPRVGPRGLFAGEESRVTDFGMDRVSPRDFDPMGTPRERFGELTSDLLSRQARNRRA